MNPTSDNQGQDARLQNVYFQLAESTFRQEQSAQRQEELLLALTRGPLSQGHNSSTNKPKVKAAKPKKYNGKPEELRSFLLSLRVYLMADPSTYVKEDCW